MTGNEFIDTLRSKADFVRPEDLESLISFYENRLLKAKSADEEEKIVQGFGDIDVVLKRIKVEYAKLAPSEPAYTAKPENEESTISPAISRDASEHKPQDEPKPEPETPPAPPQEDVKIFSPSQQITRAIPENSAKTASSTKNEAPKPKETKTYYGLTNTILDKMNLPKEKRKGWRTALYILFSPVFLLLSIALALVYSAAFVAILLCAAILCVIEAALILVSVAELVYALISFVQSIPIALIELGLGTVLISLVTAITALVYQLLTGAIPSAMKKITKLCKHSFRFCRDFFFGSKGGKE